MTAKWLMMTIALAILVAPTGCQTWCARHYPCQQPVACAPAQSSCAPCCQPCQPVGYTPAVVPAAPVSQQGWNNPRCTPCNP